MTRYVSWNSLGGLICLLLNLLYLLPLFPSQNLHNFITMMYYKIKNLILV